MMADQLRATKIANPLAEFSHKDLSEKGEASLKKIHIGKEQDIRAFLLGAILTQESE